MANATTLQLRKTRLEWLARRLALSGCMSRREAVAAIEDGAVQVDGRAVRRDVQVCDEAIITFEGVFVFPVSGIHMSPARNYNFINQRFDKQGRTGHPHKISHQNYANASGRQLPGAATWPALFGMIKPPRVACKYTLDAMGPTLKSFLASQRPDNEQTWPQEIPRSYSGYLKTRGSEDPGRGRANTWDQEVGRDDFEEREGGSAPGTGLSDQRDRSMLDRPGNERAPSRINSSTTPLPGHLIPVNSLPLHAEGLVLLTNDGGFAHALRDPANKLITAYDFRISGSLPLMDLWRQWALGVREGGIDYGPIWVQLLRPCPSGAWLRLKLVEPPGADFRSLLGAYGLKIRRMRLHSFGPYLTSSVPPGCLFPLQIDHALLPLAPRQRRRLMLVPAEGEIQRTLQATEQAKSLKGGGFAAARLLKENSVLVKPGAAGR